MDIKGSTEAQPLAGWRMGARRSLALVAVLLVAGCNGELPEPQPEDEPSAEQAVRPSAPFSLPGDLLLEEGLLRFQPCGLADAQPVDDETGSEARTLIENLGYGTDRVRSAVVLDGGRLLEVRHATPEGARCEDLLPDAEWEARGNEPFWVLRVTGGEALWITPDDQEGITFEGGEWRQADPGLFRYEARLDGVDGVEYLTLILEEEPCHDTMAGARFPFVAQVEKGGSVYAGCALEGRGLVPGL